jgi:hypothetical protein
MVFKKLVSEWIGEFAGSPVMQKRWDKCGSIEAREDEFTASLKRTLNILTACGRKAPCSGS